MLVGVCQNLAVVLIWILLRRILLNNFSYTYQSFRSPLFMSASSSLLPNVESGYLFYVFVCLFFSSSMICDSSFIFWIGVQCQMQTVNIIVSQFVFCLLTLLMLTFDKQKFFINWISIKLFSDTLNDCCVLLKTNKTTFCLFHFLFSYPLFFYASGF